jgi:hypothetical protein
LWAERFAKLATVLGWEWSPLQAAQLDAAQVDCLFLYPAASRPLHERQPPVSPSEKPEMIDFCS